MICKKITVEKIGDGSSNSYWFSTSLNPFGIFQILFIENELSSVDMIFLEEPERSIYINISGKYAYFYKNGLTVRLSNYYNDWSVCRRRLCNTRLESYLRGQKFDETIKCLEVLSKFFEEFDISLLDELKELPLFKLRRTKDEIISIQNKNK